MTRLMGSVCLLYALSLAANAQFLNTDQKDVGKIKNSTLLLVLEEPDPKIVSKLSKKYPKALEDYQAQIAGRNFALRYALENHWDFSDRVEFHPEATAFDLIEKNPDEYVLVSFGQYLEYERIGLVNGSDGHPAGWSASPNGELAYNPTTKYTVLSKEITTLEISDTKPLVSVFLPSVYPSLPGAVYGVQQIQYLLNYLAADEANKMSKLPKQIEENNLDLKDKVLLIDQNDVDPKVAAEELAEVYPYPVELVDPSVIREAILTRDARYAYLQIVSTPGERGSIDTHVIVDAADGKIYYYVTPGLGVGSYSALISDYRTRIKERHFKSYAVD
ncbi:hypothetical protein [Marinoscillum sp.]|uniref:hypothetical protein n=1 Tax=Marinoscillum sp. TaxID=2024838 RepID=UPI003BA9364D